VALIHLSWSPGLLKVSVLGFLKMQEFMIILVTAGSVVCVKYGNFCHVLEQLFSFFTARSFLIVHFSQYVTGLFCYNFSSLHRALCSLLASRSTHEAWKPFRGSVTLNPGAASLILISLADSPLELSLIRGQHGHRDVTKALLLPSIFRGKSVAAKWPPPVP
jgi:hypothetical protein